LVEENETLTSDFKEKEVDEAILQLENNKALRSDGFLEKFIRNDGKLKYSFHHLLW
jgi:hypothetical protein